MGVPYFLLVKLKTIVYGMCLILPVVLATVDSQVPEAPTVNWVGGTQQRSVHCCIGNKPHPQALWAYAKLVVLMHSVYFWQHCLNKKWDDPCSDNSGQTKVSLSDS